MNQAGCSGDGSDNGSALLAPVQTDWAKSVKDTEAANAPTELLVCTTCRAGRAMDDDDVRPGARLHDALGSFDWPAPFQSHRELFENNFARYSSEAYDNAMNSALAATDEKVRQGFYDQAEQLLAADMPIAPIYYYMQARLVRPTVGGFAKNNVEGRIYSKDLYIKK